MLLNGWVRVIYFEVQFLFGLAGGHMGCAGDRIHLHPVETGPPLKAWHNKTGPSPTETSCISTGLHRTGSNPCWTGPSPADFIISQVDWTSTGARSGPV